MPAPSAEHAVCTLVLLRRPGHRWPLLLAGNRDEMADRPWLPPARHWPDRPRVTGGLDLLAGGTWAGVNDDGVVAVILNRAGTLGPDPRRRSRGTLVLQALDHPRARDAAARLAGLDSDAYRPFNLVIADARDAYWLRGDGRRVDLLPVADGLHMLTAYELNDATDPRIRRWLPRFRAAPAADPETGDWSTWESLLACRDHAADESPRAAMCFALANGFGTVSSLLVALPASGGARWRFAAGAPDREPFRTV